MKNWQHTTLEKIAELKIGKTPPREQSQYWNTDKNYPFCSIADLRGNGSLVTSTKETVSHDALADNKAKLSPKGSLLMSFKLSLGKVGYAATDMCTNEAIVTIIPDEVVISKKFLGYWLENLNLEDYANVAVKGKTLNQQILKDLPVSYPPLKEQAGIIALLESLDCYVSKLKQQLTAQKVVMSSLMLSMLKDNETSAKAETLESISELGGGTTPSTNIEEYWGGTHAWLTPTDVTGFTGEYIQAGKRSLTDSGFKAYGRKKLPAKTVLFTSRASVGYIALASAPLNVNQGFITFVCDETKIIPEYLTYWLQINLSLLKSLAKGTTFLEISKSVMSQVPILVPAIKQQEEVVNIIEAARIYKVTIEANLQKALDAREGLMQKIFTLDDK